MIRYGFGITPTKVQRLGKLLLDMDLIAIVVWSCLERISNVVRQLTEADFEEEFHY